MTKPPYQVPTMKAIRRRRSNGLTVVSTFAGAGGSCTGYLLSGFKVRWASEFEPNAAACYAVNHPSTLLDTRDLREVSAAEILAACDGQVPDVLDGSPPCQSFSMAGSRQRRWGDVMEHADGTYQRSDDLFFVYANLLTELQPRAFVAENVAGLAQGTAKGMFKEIHRALTAAGYRVGARILDAQWLGVPQQRRRVFFVGIRADLDLEPPFPTPLPYRYSILDACPWLGDDSALRIDPRGQFDTQSRHVSEPAPTIRSASPHQHTITEARLETSYGGIMGNHVPHSLEEPAPTVMTPARMTVRQGGWKRTQPQSLDEPIPTIMTIKNGEGTRVRPAARRARAAHPSEPSPTVLASPLGWSDIDVRGRPLTIAEVKRLCSFPDDYELVGTYTQQWARLGNSVPPLMMAAVSAGLRDALSAL